MSPEREEKRIKTWITEGIVIALITAISYICAFRYESSYATVFKIPNDLIELNLVIIIYAWVSILSLLILVFIVFEALFVRKIPKEPGPIWKRLIQLSPFFIFFYIYLNLYIKQWREWVWLLGILCLLFIILFIWPLFIKRGVKGYIEKLKAVDENDRKNVHEYRSLADLITVNRRKFFIILGLIFFSFGIAGAAGRASALNKTNFLVVNASPEMVVLRIYGDKVICATFDRNVKEIQNNLIIFKISNDNKISFSNEKIGPLRMKAD